MAGFGFQLSPSATLDVGYRYLSRTCSGPTRSTMQDFRNSIATCIGIRYMAN